MLSDLEKSILKTVCFFDVLDYPITLMEVWKWLDCPASLKAVRPALAAVLATQAVSFENGFYFLRGRQDLVDRRLSRYALSDKKFKKALRVIRFLKHLPWVRAIAVYGSLSFSNPRAAGDIDLFVVAKAKRLWSCRFFVNSFLKIFWLRPSPGSKADKICVSYLAAEDGLDLSVANDGDLDYFYQHGVGAFIFLFERGQIAEKFFAASGWVKNAYPNLFRNLAGCRRRAKAAPAHALAEIFARPLSEKLLRAIQMRIMPRRLKALANKDKRVILGDRLIKSHDNDQHAAVNEKFLINFKKVLENANAA